MESRNGAKLILENILTCCLAPLVSLLLLGICFFGIVRELWGKIVGIATAFNKCLVGKPRSSFWKKKRNCISRYIRYQQSNEDHLQTTILKFQIMTAVQVHNLYSKIWLQELSRNGFRTPANMWLWTFCVNGFQSS